MMFSSLKLFIFGTNDNRERNSDEINTETATASATGLNEPSDTNAVLVQPIVPLPEKIEKKSIKSGKNKRNNARQQNKRKEKQVKVLSPHNSCEDSEELDEDEWCIVEKQSEEQEAVTTRSDSEDEYLDFEVSEINKAVDTAAGNTLGQQRRHQHINSHSLYGGPRPQKQRNFLQKNRHHTGNRPASGLSVSALSPSRTAHDACSGGENENAADGGVTRSLCVTPSKYQQNEAPNSFEGCHQMEGSWYITPPPCFTSVGPVDMETSPYENLLIEHPSMSVYHSIRRAQEATESFVKLDISENEVAEKENVNESSPKKERKNQQSISPHTIYRLYCNSVTEVKEEVLAQNEQKVQIKYRRQDNCRSAIKRINKVRDVQSRNHIQRRSDRQHSRYCSNANNNRKTNCH